VDRLALACMHLVDPPVCSSPGSRLPPGRVPTPWPACDWLDSTLVLSLGRPRRKSRTTFFTACSGMSWDIAAARFGATVTFDRLRWFRLTAL
jgi:hypothetical protein